MLCFIRRRRFGHVFLSLFILGSISLFGLFRDISYCLLEGLIGCDFLLFFSTNSSAFWNLEVSMLIEPDVGQSPHDTPGTGYFKAGLAQAVILICTTIRKCLSNPPTDTAFVFLFASACSRSKIKGLLLLSLLLCVLHLNFS